MFFKLLSAVLLTTSLYALNPFIPFENIGIQKPTTPFTMAVYNNTFKYDPNAHRRVNWHELDVAERVIRKHVDWHARFCDFPSHVREGGYKENKVRFMAFVAFHIFDLHCFIISPSLPFFVFGARLWSYEVLQKKVAQHSEILLIKEEKARHNRLHVPA